MDEENDPLGLEELEKYRQHAISDERARNTIRGLIEKCLEDLEQVDKEAKARNLKYKHQYEFVIAKQSLLKVMKGLEEETEANRMYLHRMDDE